MDKEKSSIVNQARNHISCHISNRNITLSVFTVTSKSMTVQWSSTIAASSYKITATPKSSPQPQVFAQFSGNTVMGSVNSLLPNTVYTMQLEAMDNNHHVLSSAVTEETTAPDVPSIEQAYSKDSMSITVEFTAVSGATSYILRAETENGDFFSETPVASSPGTVTQLKAYTEYSLSVMSVNIGGRSQPSYPVNARTVVMAPELNTTSPSNSTIVVTWPPVDHAVLYTLTIIQVGSNTRQKINTTGTSWTFDGLEPGTEYSIKGTAWDSEGRAGDDHTVYQITRPPSPDVTSVHMDQGRTLGIVVYWMGVQGANNYMAFTTSGQNCTASETFCYIIPADCGQNESVTVIAYNEAGPSSPSDSENYITYPCPPENITVEEPTASNCSVVWDDVPLVDYYVAFIKRDDGTESSCNTTETYCPFFCMCGFTYLTTVFPHNKAGTSPSAHVRNYTTIPCCPDDVSIKLVSTETLEIMWTPVKGAEMYETTAAESLDVIHCNDTAPVCALSDLMCNTAYSVTVTPCSDLRGCNRTCTAHTHETAPCTPEILNMTQSDQSTYKVVFTTPNTPNTNYTITATGRYNTHTCRSSHNSCMLTELPCGSTYDVIAVASNMVARSLPGFSKLLETGPCCPKSVNVTQVTQAMSNVTWTPAKGARSYITTLMSSRGEAKCHTLDTHCLMGCITCGTNYSVNMEAISSTGHMSECSYQGFSTKPCCPTSLKLYRRANNTLRVYWRSMGPQIHSHTVDLYGTAANYTCIAAAGSRYCDIHEETCGDVYTVVAAPVGNDGIKVNFCLPRTYSVLCPGSNAGMVISRGRRIPATSQITFSKAISSTSLRFEWSSVTGAEIYTLFVETIESPVCRNRHQKYYKDNQNVDAATNWCVYYKDGKEHSPSDVEHNINPVTKITVDYSCSSGMVTVNWDLVFGANLYRATAIDGTGASLNCTSSSTSCQITMLLCGEKYHVHVTAISDDCESISNSTSMFETVPCAPANPTASHDCSSNHIKFSWQPTNNTLSYMATAVDNNGKIIYYRGVDEYCYFTNVGCGQYYTFTVYAISSGCNSESSHPEFVRTSPCHPTNIKTSSDCLADQLITTWDSAAGAFSYTVEVQGNTGDPLNCTTSSTSCAVHGVPCGEHLSVWLIASNDNCSTEKVLGQAAQTVPCTPTNASVAVECSQDSARVNWTQSIGSVFYIAIAESTDGHSRSCYSFGTNCLIEGLRCGQNYTASVIGTNTRCNSSNSEQVTFMTGPCPPTNIQSFRDCDANQALIVWQDHTSTGHYTAVIEDQSGDRLNCTSNTVSNCKIYDLPCGKRYNVTVSHSDGNCLSTSTSVSMDSVPCKLENVNARVACVTGELTVTWDISAPADNYSAIITRGMGERLYCNSTESPCTMPGLLCGSSYMVTVFSITGTCFSLPSTAITVRTLSCPPTNITTQHTCAPDPVPVSWEASQSAQDYTAVAVSSGGHRSECMTNETSCSLPGLQCGEVYSIGVSGAVDNCMGPQSDTVLLNTEPCSPENVSSQLDCSAGIAQVSWAPMANAIMYAMKATVNGQIFTCNNPSPNCTLNDLICGQEYNIVVTATDGTCVSRFSAPYRQDEVPCAPSNVTTNLCGQTYNVSVKASSGSCCGPYSHTRAVQTAPCSPQNLTAVSECGTDSLLASWSASLGATSYTVTVTGPNGFSESCSSSNLNCSISGLQCASQYNIAVTSQNSDCASSPTQTVMTTGPCDPVNVTSILHCGSDTATVSWEAAAGAVSYTVLAQEDGFQHYTSCWSTTTSCQLDQLQCGGVYNLTVIAEGSSCNSTGSISATLMTAPCSPSIQTSTLICGTSSTSVSWLPMAHATVPCAPVNVSVSLVCASHSALVSWVQSPNAIRYNVTSRSASDGHLHDCQTNTTSCQLTDIHCGETYHITVTPYSETCAGHPSADYVFRAGLCAPSNVIVSPACEDSIVLWSNVTGAEMFVATATTDGHSHTCSSNDSNLCNFTDLHCGDTYAVTVVTVDRGCQSEPSSAVPLKTALCPATNLTGQANCDANTLTLTWDQSPTSGVTYSLQTERTGSGISPTDYITPNTSHTLTNLLCGQRYAFRIAVQDGACRSSYSPPIEISTVPCQPTNFTAHVDCGTNQGNFSWSETSEAGFYTVEVTGEHGHVASCSSNDTSCAVKLHCGRTYSATLVASTESCNSSKHADIHFDSAPCLLEDVFAEVQCNTNVMNVTWTQTTGSDDYTAWAISTDGHRASCNTSTSNSCCINNLQCGKVYEVAVNSSSMHCEVIAGSDYKVQSAPCKPENISIDQNCSSNAMTVTWNQRSTTQNYTVKATSASGINVTCDSTESSCCFLDLSCGQLYTFTVMGYTNVCMSEMSTPVQKLTAPCPPTSVVATINCTTHNALVSWSSAAAATGYSVQATTTNGHNTSCSAMGTSCDLNNLVCGQEYSVVVEAMHSGCPGPASNPTTLVTEPCVPTDLTVNYNVSTAQVMWGAASGASSYSVHAVTDQGPTVTCNTINTNCFLNGLQCSHIYNVTVMAQNMACNDTVTSEPYCLNTEPCPPTNVQASMACEQLTATVSWQQSNLAVGYVAYLDNQNGCEASCVGTDTDTSCVVSGLKCGTVYNVWVMALGQQYNSSNSTVITLISAPCVPTEIDVDVNCNSDGDAVVSWNSTYGTANFSLTASVSGNLQTLCATQQNSCNVTGLACGETYNLSLTASNTQCSLTVPMHTNLTTRPCPPQHVAVNLQCGSRTAVLSWEESLDCGETYNFTVTAYSQGCWSQASNTVSIQTEPCQPVIVSVQAPCQSADVQISWQQASGVVNYLVTARGSLGYVEIYNITQTLLSAALPCGQDYNVTVQGQGSECNSIPSSPAFFNTTPCIPRSVATYVQCELNMGSVSWEPSDGAETYIAVATGLDNHTHPCLTNTTSCTWNDLHCGEQYTVVVRAIDGTCTSLPSNSTVIHMEPCQPVIVSVQAPCQSADVQISWQQASGVVNYLVTARGSLGYVEIYNITQTLLSAALPCGQDYNVTVQGQGSECNSIPSSPAFFNTTPCIPRNVTTYLQCELNVGSVSWEPSDGAETYIAVATGLDNHTHPCLTNTTSCTWNDLHCGEQYTVVVKAIDGTCTSLPSNSTVIHMDPCVPQNLSPTVNCNTEVVSLSWDAWPCPPVGIFTRLDCLSANVMVSWQASDGSDYYTATLQSETGSPETCCSESNSCSIPSLPCGHNFSVSVTASNEQCNTTSRETTSLQSVPCVPTNVLVVVNCANNTAVVSWSASRGAVQYSVRALSNHGNDSCQTSDLSCSLDSLTCGTSYSVQVAAMDDNCSSIFSQAVTFNSAGCSPQNVSAEVSCLSNDLTISWDPVREADYFLVSVIADDGGISETLNTTNTAASISNVTCGRTFSVQATSVIGSCSSQHSHTVSALSAPCQPQGISGRIDCVTNSAWISWNASAGADNYIVSAVGGDNLTASCTTSTNTTCEVEDLACGALYNFTVTAYNRQCASQPSAIIQLQTAPCSLASITAVPQCHNSSILVMWDLMDGGESNTVYRVTAEARDQTYLSCNSTGTSCYLYGAQCDFRYSIIVAASSDQCSSMRSPPVRISMEPCPPTNLVVNVSCEDNSALVSWSPSPVAETYQAVAMAADGHVHTCNTTSNSCRILDLHCDEQYVVFVTASHENCTSQASQNVTINTGPCKPVGLAVMYYCNNQSARLSWTSSDNTEDYYGCAQAANGDMLYCHSTDPTCTIQGLDCGTVYNFSVQASDGTCNSSFSDPVQSGAVPCPPDTLEVQLLPVLMEIQLFHFSWSQITCNNTEYMLKLTGSLHGDSSRQFDFSSYWTSVTYFEMPLPCGSNYSATVRSRNAAGTSDPSVPLIGITAPCPPTGVVYDGNSSFARITWNAAAFATTYRVYDSGVTPQVLLCNTTGLTCSLSNISYTELVITACNAVGESLPQNITIVTTQGRRRRDVGEQMPDSAGGLVAPMLEVTQGMGTMTLAEWSQVDAASHYSLIIKQQGSSSTPQELIVYGERMIFTDLSPNTIYCLTVSAMNLDTSGPESEPVCVQTGQ
ncbi:Fibronectin type III domain-containing protein 7 Precursor [Larimichthys crocea]|uniref:Fibronectin type III domain-containing protein 7 n=1 Tax=Larimichthys crocea TaxID=215358 RepID=A0A6G0IHK4_LARCR|nr:Fibronectin type III domain-containing protein 7 Precursor [Larimichthys crocea]